MFRTSCVHHQEDHLYILFLYGMFFMRVCKQSSRWKVKQFLVFAKIYLFILLVVRTVK